MHGWMAGTSRAMRPCIARHMSQPRQAWLVRRRIRLRNVRTYEWHDGALAGVSIALRASCPMAGQRKREPKGTGSRDKSAG